MTDTATLDLFLPVPVRLAALFQRAGKSRTLSVAIVLTAVSAISDWQAGTDVSMGLLYMAPLMIAAVVLRPAAVVVLAAVCATLGMCFYHPDSSLQSALHFLFSLVANSCAGLFVSSAVRNRQLVLNYADQLKHEHELREMAEEQVRGLMESRTAGVLTIDESGVVMAANNAANVLLAVPDGETIQGASIREYIPVLADTLQIAKGKAPYHAAAQCQGRRSDGELFVANVWYSTYQAAGETRLAAIVVDSSEEMRDQAEQELRQMSLTNRVTAAAVSHEVRNFCGAISLLYSNLKRSEEFVADRRFQNLGNLVEGLEKIASMELRGTVQEEVEEVPLQQVLNDLRIVIEPAWKEIGGTVSWETPRKGPSVLGQRHGLLQVFLNLAQNSRRAVQDRVRRELAIEVRESSGRVAVRFRDSGPGVRDQQRLFQPFESDSGGAGMGLYISRAILRNYGGELKYEAQAEGACFAVELQAVANVRKAARSLLECEG